MTTTTFDNPRMAAAREEARLFLEAEIHMGAADYAAAKLKVAFDVYLRAVATAWQAYAKANMGYAFAGTVSDAFFDAPASLRALIERAVICGEDLVPLLPEQGQQP